ncbi:hypothetical protein KKG22_03820 [Patescibacteria group bacterium]|nr:hypothetical protein [Patescibacteria group bacterium]MBU1721275.1 hypothetical protein [Patescibacteria group bacterium]MBU1901017.1 hypothetical protein [Patescibacteria group bacterium]
MDLLQIANALVVMLGIPTILGAFLVIGKKFQKLDDLSNTINNRAIPDLADVRERMSGIEQRVTGIEKQIEVLWGDRLAPAKSPRQLNEKGMSILQESGIKQIVDKKRNELLKTIKEKKLDNAYDTEQAIFDILRALPETHPELINELKQGAFTVGEDINAILFVGGIYLRNIIFDDLGFHLKHTKKEKVML